MKNKNVGFLICFVAIIMLFIVFLFSSTVKSNLDLTCTHGSSCLMHEGLNKQTWLAYVLTAAIFLIGLFLIFVKEESKIVIRRVNESKKKISLDGLDKDEKEAIKILLEENGAMFQASLMERMNIGKVKMTRLIDKLEAKLLVERKRRGMNNLVVLRK